MTVTSPLVTFGLYALQIKQDATLACPDLQPFSSMTDLKSGSATTRPYITYEPDFWLLDGQYKFKPTNNAAVHVGLMSLSMSNAAGVFAIPPVLTATFSEIHTTDGLTLHFSQYTNDYCNDLTIAFYDATNVLIRSDAYNPATWELSTGQAVTDFKKIVITFNSTNKAYRYLRMVGIDFGQLIYFTAADIKSCTVVEEFNPLSTELPVDTLDLKLFSSDAAFSIINPAGDYAALQNKQPLDVYENVGNDRIYIGQFFLSTWENPSNTGISFKAIDMLGVLDTVPFSGYLGHSDWEILSIEDFLNIKLGAIGVPYDLDTELLGVQLEGWIPATSYREALQQVAFAAGAYVTCSRAGILQIFKTVLASEVVSQDFDIPASAKGIDSSLTLKTLVTGVDVTAHNYVSNTDVTELFKKTLAVGQYTIAFSEPHHDLIVTGAAFYFQDANYAIITVSSPGLITITGQGYTDTTQVYNITNGTLDANVRQNVIAISDATLINPSNVVATTQRVYDYYQQRYLQKVKLYSPTAAVSDSVLIDTLYNQRISGVVEKMNMDLSGGFRVNAEITGIVAP